MILKSIKNDAVAYGFTAGYYLEAGSIEKEAAEEGIFGRVTERREFETSGDFGKELEGILEETIPPEVFSQGQEAIRCFLKDLGVRINGKMYVYSIKIGKKSG
ncbi:MAG: hypothetical protein JSW08_03605 [archaeon]|nr:MAG: hypothetical protein JSW08_03605 [archaeon]